jgi:hypothetical protein
MQPARGLDLRTPARRLRRRLYVFTVSEVENSMLVFYSDVVRIANFLGIK